jgi:nitrite reductase/ring-hydroxylating ferredoxin subunit/DMSO/TMAO reductase YedYZ heme-binding membrane subunit
MSLRYRAINWNRQKRIYDSVLGLSVLAYLAVFVGLGSWVHPHATIETLLIRGLATAALLLLHVVLSIGPLCRLDRRFLPLLYNRRHLGVMTFLLGLAHGTFALIQFHGFGDLNPLVSLLVGNTRYNSLAQFPFQQLGALALIILFLMAATSHDFWLRNLTPAVWKRLHMSVYVAYTLLIAHVVLGVLQSETNPILAVLLAAGMTVVIGLHLAAALRERRVDLATLATREGFVQVCPVESICEKRARVFSANGERIAVFRYGNQVSALSNVCAHQNGPLGEGRIIDGCVTCPWHGYQYLPQSGASPPPFHEKVPTYRVKVIDGKVFVHPQSNPPGTPVEPAQTQSARGENRDEFYVGYEPKAPPKLGRRTISTVAVLCAFTLCISLLLVKGQRPFAPAVFEFQQYKGFEGLVEGRPVPTLLVRRPGATGGLPAVSRYPLVLPGKHGALLAVKDFDGTQVQLRGSLIYNSEQTMIELLPNSIRMFPQVHEQLAGQTAVDDLGVRTLVGEIVDTKCYFGVMNPGSSKVHRDCAVRCISGGIPPGLLVRSQDGMSTVLLLVGQDGQQLSGEILDKVAEPVEIRGRVVRSGDTLRLSTNPQSIRRL